MNVLSRDEFPTPRFPEVDKTITELHNAYRTHPTTMPGRPEAPSVLDENREATEDPFKGSVIGEDAFGRDLGDTDPSLNQATLNTSIDRATPTDSKENDSDLGALSLADTQSQAQAELQKQVGELQRRKLELANKTEHVRSAVELLRKPIILKQRILMAGTGIVGFFLGYGSAISLIRGIGLPSFLWIPIALLPSAGLTFLVWRTAQTSQLVQEADKEPRKVPYLSHLADCYTKLVLNESPDDELPPEKQQILLRRLAKWKQERQEGMERDEAAAQKRLMMATLSVVVAFLLLTCVYAYGFNPLQRVLESLLIFGLPAALTYAAVFLLAPVSLRLPLLGETHEELTKIESEIRTAELELKQIRSQIEFEERTLSAKARAEATARAKKEAEIRWAQNKEEANKRQAEEQKAAEARAIADKKAESERQKLDSEYQRRLREWSAQGEKMLEVLRKTASEWESERGFTAHERVMLERQLKEAKAKEFGLAVLSFLSIVALTYFASITLNEILTGSYIYPFGNVGMRIALFPWIIWIATIYGAEKLALVPGLAKLHAIRMKESVLQHGFERTNRVKGHRYVFLTPEEAAKARKAPYIALSVGVVVIGIELACNLIYLFKYSDVEGLLGYLIALLPAAFFILLMFPLADADEEIKRIKEALLTPERPSQAGLGPVPTSNRDVAVMSERAHKAWEGLGFKDPDSRR